MTLTAPGWSKPVPRMRTLVPPAATPLAGLRPVTVMGAPVACTNVAETDSDWVSCTMQFAVPEQPPDQVCSVWPVAGVATNVMTVPSGTDSVQSDAPGPQLIPAGRDVTVPEPVTLTVSVRGAFCVNVAVQVLSSTICTAAPQPAPDQPLKLKPADGVAVRAIVAPSVNGSLQSVPQLMPTGVDVTVPEPDTMTVSIRVFG